MMHPSDIQWWKTHSADYVLGLLSNSERLVFERIMPIEPELQEFVVDWREKLQPMSDALVPIKPPDHILPTLISNIPITTNHDVELEARSATQDNSTTNDNSASAGTALVVASAVPASVNRSLSNRSLSLLNGPDSEFIDLSTAESTEQITSHEGAPSDFQNQASVGGDADAVDLADGTAFMRMLEGKQEGIDAWRSYAGLATAACLLMALLGWMGFQKAQSDRVEPTFDSISIVQNSEAKALWVVDSSTDEKQLRVTAVAPPALKEGQAFELWMVKPNEGGVVSMGLLPSNANVSTRFNVHRFSADAESFGVSVESDKGSPESIPTGPIVFKGKIQSLSE